MQHPCPPLSTFRSICWMWIVDLIIMWVPINYMVGEVASVRILMKIQRQILSFVLLLANIHDGLSMASPIHINRSRKMSSTTFWLLVSLPSRTTHATPFVTSFLKFVDSNLSRPIQDSGLGPAPKSCSLHDTMICMPGRYVDGMRM